MSSTALPSMFADKRAHLAARVMLAIGLGSLLSLSIALIAQHGFGIEPCAWCIVQRMTVILVAAVALASVLLARVQPRAAPIVGALLAGALSVAGLVAAWHQHTVAAKQLSCAFTWADRTLMSLQLDALWPGLFRVGATCADAAKATLLGLPFELWSGMWFGLCAALSAWALYRMLAGPRRLFS